MDATDSACFIIDHHPAACIARIAMAEPETSNLTAIKGNKFARPGCRCRKSCGEAHESLSTAPEESLSIMQTVGCGHSLKA